MKSENRAHEQIRNCVSHLGFSRTGWEAMYHLAAFLRNGGLNLDEENRLRIAQLLGIAWSCHGIDVLDALEVATAVDHSRGRDAK